MRFVRVIVALVMALPLLTSDSFAAAGTKLTVQVNSASTGKPIDRASVIVRFRHGLNPIKMKKIQTNWETKTSQEGTVSIPEIPMGEVEIQVIAKYYQTSGGIYTLDQPTQTVQIKLNPPQTQYSEDAKTK